MVRMMRDIPRSHLLGAPLAAVVLLLAVACSDDGDDPDASVQTDDDVDTTTTEETAPGAEESVPPEVEPAVLTSDDVEGWEVNLVEVSDELPLGDCPDLPEVLNDITNVVRTELRATSGPGADLNGLFQEVVTLTDSSAAEAFLDLPDDFAATCEEGGESVDFETSSQAPLDLPDDLGDRSSGSHLEFEPGPFSDVIDGMDVVRFQRDNVVVMIAGFSPLADEVDLIELASGVDSSL
jgi:hypothetical protein